MCGKPCCHVCKKVLSGIFIVIALVMAVAVSSSQRDQLFNVIVGTNRFFDVMLPILGAGALIKFLLCGIGSGCCGGCQGSSCQKEKCEVKENEKEQEKE